MAPEDWLIRPAAPEDLAPVAVVYSRSVVDSLSWLRPDQCHTDAEHRAYFREVIAQQCDVWLAEAQSRILGVLAMQGDEVDRLYVDTPSQGRGVGTSLLEHAKGLSPTGLRLVTLQRNSQARSCYERHGFVATAFGTSPPPESEPVVSYRWIGDGGS